MGNSCYGSATLRIAEAQEKCKESRTCQGLTCDKEGCQLCTNPQLRSREYSIVYLKKSVVPASGLTEQNCYNKLDSRYLGGYANGVSTHFSNAADAKDKCNTLSECNGVTCNSRSQSCTVRKSSEPKYSPTKE